MTIFYCIFRHYEDPPLVFTIGAYILVIAWLMHLVTLLHKLTLTAKAGDGCSGLLLYLALFLDSLCCLH